METNPYGTLVYADEEFLPGKISINVTDPSSNLFEYQNSSTTNVLISETISEKAHAPVGGFLKFNLQQHMFLRSRSLINWIERRNGLVERF